MKKLWRELKTRFVGKSPRFWKRVRNIAAACGSSALAIIQADRFWALGIDADIISVCGYIVAVCAGMGLSAQLTTTTPTPPEEMPK